jgi:hypothetical protein
MSNIIKGKDAMDFKDFQDKMITALEEHYPRYGDSWKEMSRGKLLDRLKHKFAEFDLTLHEKKLISLANLAMLLYIRMKEKPPASQNPNEMM